MGTEVQTGATVTGTYVYCVVPTASEATESTAFGASIDASTPVRTVRENGLTAVVSDALQAQYDPSRANVGAHERIVREAYEGGDVLPMRFGTVARDDAAVQRFLVECIDILAIEVSALGEEEGGRLTFKYLGPLPPYSFVKSWFRRRAKHAGLLANVLLAPFTGPYYGLRFVMNALRQQVESESSSEEQRLQEELVALNMRLEIGEISESEFATKEAAVLEKLRAFRSGNEAGGAMA